MEKSNLPYWFFAIAAGLFIFVIVITIWFIRNRTFFVLYKGAGNAWKESLKNFPLGILVSVVAILLSFPLATAWGPNKDTILSIFSMCPKAKFLGEEISNNLCMAGAKFALALGANPDHTNFYMKESPLSIALLLKNNEMVDLLLDAGADVLQVYGDTRKQTPIEYGIADPKHFDRFIELAGGPHVLIPPRNENLLYPAILHAEAPDYNRDAILKLMDYGLDINQPFRTDSEISPFFFACLHFDAATIEALIKKGADATRISAGNYTPAHFAVSNQDPEVMRVLIRHGADVNVISDCGTTPLMDARKDGNEEVVKVLEQHLGQRAKLPSLGDSKLDDKDC
ncbi:MAG: ankyrin repeat domain-containing protein [Candidatus Nitronauta litoralis]|uniref:Ankyrin repeat domain-containing protein n=1 Tax=Candidatus Nitronauta litoralis TaxID=2705533 RepID=A0A7T0BUR9_9BACT|nr:MAG: ankyrin repeat domain-containing protein [Candidatus Nitronauta litoralis]